MSILAFILMLAGFISLVAEITIIPGFGIAGIMGWLLMGSSGAVAYWGGLTLASAVASLGSAVFLGMGFAYWAFFIFPNTKAAKKLILENNPEIDNAVAVDSHEELIGLEGKTTTILRPSGKAQIGDQIYDVMAEGGAYIEKDTTIVVKDATFGKITVAVKK